MSNSPICFALDFPSLVEVRDFFDRNHVAPHIGAVKVGLELFVSSGRDAVSAFAGTGVDIVLDLKLHDIPETVGRAVRAGGDLGAKFMTLHVQQKAALEAAIREAEPYGITLLGVTVLTSMSCEDLSHLEMERRLGDTVNSVIFRAGALAGFAHSCGLRGFVCSPLEVASLRGRFPESFFLVPGVRPVGSDSGDQRRTGTPGQAVRDGASLIVVGRPIRDAVDPVQAAKDILANIGQAEVGQAEVGQAEEKRDCGGCGNRAMDMDMDPYCSAVNRPFGQTLARGRPPECGQTFRLWTPDVRRSSSL